MDYKKKYLKYKKKYLALKTGGTLTTEIIDLGNFKNCLFNIFFAMYFVAKNEHDGKISVYAKNTKNELLDVAYDFMTFMVNDMGLNYNSGLFEFVDDVGNTKELTYDDLAHYIRYTGNTKYFQIIDPPDNKINLVESVLGLALNLGVNPEVLSQFENDVIKVSPREINIIDFQNVLNVLNNELSAVNFNNINSYSQREKLKICTRLILEFCARTLSWENYVIMVVKPSSMLSEKDISDIFFLDNPSDSLHPQSTIRRYLNIKFFLISFNFVTNPAVSSNFDDYVFWTIAMSFYKFLEVRNKTKLLKLITNDSQNLSRRENSNDKNILFFNNFSDIVHIEYIKDINNDGTIGDIIIKNSSKTTLCTYLNILREILDFNFSTKTVYGQFPSVKSFQQFTIQEINFMINHVDFEFDGHSRSMLEHLNVHGLDTYIGIDIDHYKPFLFFYAAIKYIQSVVFDSANTNNYAYTAEEIRNKILGI